MAKMAVWVRSFLAFTLVVGAGSASAQIIPATDGTAVFEAEAYSNSVSRSGRTWEFRTDTPGYSGDGFMLVTNASIAPSNINANVETTSPELRYAVDFSTTGTYFVWARGYPISGDDDSIHVGWNNAVSVTGSNLTFSPITNVWTWTNSTFGGVARTISVTSTGVSTFSIWMREDGIRIDRIALVKDGAFQPTIGNSWHIPANTEADLGVPMRNPLHGMQSNTTIQIFNGNQFRGSGNPGNQLGIGSSVIWKHATSTVWNTLPMQFHLQGTSNTNNKYFVGTFTGNTFRAGDTIQYYLRIPYSDHLPTFLYGNNHLGQESDSESVAQADPYSFTIEHPIAPSGDFLAITNATPQGDVIARIYTNGGHIAVVGSDLTGTPGANTVSFAPPSARFGGEQHPLGAVLSSSPLSNGLELVQQLAWTQVTSRLTFSAEGVVRYEVLHWGDLPLEQTFVTAPSDSSEHFYGFGEKFNDFDQAGRVVKMLTDDFTGTKGDRSYKVAPWFISTRGYGFHLDSSAESYFNMRASFADRYVITNIFPSLRFNVVYGPQLTNVLIRYTGYTGRPQTPPMWSFSPWISSDHWRNGGEVRYILTKYRERGLAGSVLVFDSPWETAYNDFSWNSNQFSVGFTNESQSWSGFATIQDMLGFIRSNGFKVICWMTPFVNTNSVQDAPGITNGYAKNYAEGSNNNYFVRSSTGGPPLVVSWWKGRGSPIDFTYTNATLWLQSQLSNLVAESGGVIGGFKTDDGESGNPPYSYIPKSAVYHDGRTGVEMANAYATLYHRAVWQVLGTSGLLFARSGFTGSHAYPGYWAGDNEPNFGQENGLASVVVAGQSAAMSGYSIWGHDVGGYLDCCFSSSLTNLFMRWTQFGAFSPLMQMHRQIGTGQQYPWSFGPEGLTNYHYYTRLNTALVPYTYSYARESSLNGLPIIRPLVLVHPDDPGTFGLRHTYLFGNDILVGVVVTNVATSRNVYLPAGLWFDWWNGTAYPGGSNIVWVNANQREFPVFAREGAIIPMMASNALTLLDSSYTGHTNIPTFDSSLDIRLYPGAQGSAMTFYDDSHATLASNDTVVTFTLTGTVRSIALRVRGGTPFGVEKNGVRLPKMTNATDYALATRGWLADTSGFVRVKVPHGGSTVIRLGPDTLGDGIPNSWRQHHFGNATTTNALTCATCDADGDGIPNAGEYIAGTSPVDSNDVLRIQSASFQPVSGTNNVVLAWPAEEGITYSIRYKNDLIDGNPWLNVATQFTGNGGTLFWYDDGALTGTPPGNSPTGRRFYNIDAH